MNCFSALGNACKSWFLLGTSVMMAACGMSASESADQGNTGEYSVHYTLSPDPGTSTVAVSLRLRQPRNVVREIRFPTGTAITDVGGDGDLRVRDGMVVWLPPSNGGTLEWRAVVHNERGKGAFDALLNSNWGLFRAEDVIPRARTRTLRGSVSRTTMAFSLPAGWSAISEYSAKTRPILVDRPERRFDEPAGWIAVGTLGVRRETIAGTKVAVAAPQGQDVRRMEMLALLNWTLPELNSIVPGALPRLTIVSAGNPMWRGGLSAPASLFLHAGRPLISENATSPLLHEVMHVALGLRPARNHDWIAEGLAEYYGIELLHRGNAISSDRATRAFRQQARWADDATSLCRRASTGASTALAVTVFKTLDKEIMALTDGNANLDSLLPSLVNNEVDLSMLREIATEVTGTLPDALHSDNLPGCRTIDTDQEQR